MPAYDPGRQPPQLSVMDKQNPGPPIRADLQAALDRVIAEQEDRARIAAADV